MKVTNEWYSTHRTENDKCALCGKEWKIESYGSSYRVAYITNTTSGITHHGVLKGYGFYEPRLTSDELYKLSRGETNICTDRQGCRNRQLEAL